MCTYRCTVNKLVHAKVLYCFSNNVHRGGFSKGVELALGVLFALWCSLCLLIYKDLFLFFHLKSNSLKIKYNTHFKGLFSD